MSFADARLDRRHYDPPPGLTLWGAVTLPLVRAHEICGQARRTLALHVAAKAGAPLMWVSPRQVAGILNPEGMVDILPPQDVLFVNAMRPPDVLWTAEEALRSGMVPIVVADLPGPPGMVPVRRLHLAAEAGAAEGKFRPICLLLTPGEGGAPGIETRWRMEPAHRPGHLRWRVERLRARMAPPQGWWLENGRLTPGVETQEPVRSR